MSVVIISVAVAVVAAVVLLAVVILAAAAAVHYAVRAAAANINVAAASAPTLLPCLNNVEPGPALRLRHCQQSARPRGLCKHHVRVVEPAHQPLRLPPSLSVNACLDSMASSELRMERTCTRPPCPGCAWPQQPPSPETWGPPSCPALNAIYFPLLSTAGVS